MHTTIDINPELYKEAQELALSEKKSLNSIIEEFLKAFIKSKEERTVKISPFVRNLGVDMDLPTDFDEKKEYNEHLEKKYR